MKLGRPKSMERRQDIHISIDTDDLKNIDLQIEKIGIGRSEYLRNDLKSQSLSEGDLIARSTSLERQLELAKSRVQHLEKINQNTQIDPVEFEQIQKAYAKYLSKVKGADEFSKLAWLGPRAESLNMKSMKLLRLLEGEK